MVDQKITELDELTTPVSTDLIPIVEDPGGTPKTEKITLERLGLTNGWFPITKTLVYAAADDPTFTFTIAAFDATAQLSPGMKIKLTNATVKYFIITKVVFDDPGSTITVYGGTDYNLVDAAITSPFYSTQKAPLDFPLDPDKWTVEITDSDNTTQVTPITGTYYNIHSLSIKIPIGSWNSSYSAHLFADNDEGAMIDLKCTLSTANDSQSDIDLTERHRITTGSSVGAAFEHKFSRKKLLNLTTKDIYYLNEISNVTGCDRIILRGSSGAPVVIRAVCAYL